MSAAASTCVRVDAVVTPGNMSTSSAYSAN
jgi:hypothetical protein